MNWSVCVDAGEADGIDAALDVRILAIFVVEANANVDAAEADEADDAVDVAVLVAAAVDRDEQEEVDMTREYDGSR